MSIERRLKKRQIEEIRHDMLDWYGVSLTHTQADAIRLKCIQNAGMEACGFDTSCREYAAHLIGEEITGMEWPDGTMSEEYSRTFFVKLVSQAKAKGYKIDKERYKQYFLKLRFS